MRFEGAKRRADAGRARNLRPIWRVVGHGIAVAAIMVSTVTGAAAQQTPKASEPPTQPPAASPPPDRSVEVEDPIELPAPISIYDALAIVDRGAPAVDEILVAGKGIVGGVVPNTQMAPNKQAMQAELAFRSTFGVVPVVRGFVARSDASTSAIDRARARFEAADRASARRAPLPEATDRSEQDQVSLLGVVEGEPEFEFVQAQSIPDHFPSSWKGVMYPASYQVQEPQRVFDYQFSYDSATGADPTLIPDDWGLELGVTTWNFELSTADRPNCGGDGGDSNTDFWQMNYSTGAVWMSNLPSASAPYLDTNVALDSCQANGIEIGVGYPRQLSADSTYRAAIYLEAGTKDASPFSASVQLQSNDCNDAGLEPSTHCMGLNVNRVPDGGISKNQSYVNIDRGWSVPGCAAMADGWAAPQYTASGTGGCPSADGASNVIVLGFNTPLNVTIEEPDQNLAFVFAGSAGQRVSALVTDNAIGWIYLKLIGPDGKIIAQPGVVSGNLFMDTVKLPDDGIYTLLLDPYQQRTGAATVRLYDVPDDDTRNVTPGDPAVTLSSTVPGQNGKLVFVGSAGQRVSALVTDNAIGWIYLKLIGPDGKIITQPGVVSGNLTMPSTTLPLTGTYELVLDPYQQRTGTASVEVRNE